MNINSSISSKDSGNTSTESPLKKQVSPSKKWSFTLNNYTDDIISSIVPLFKGKCSVAFFAKEIGESGTPHLQGYCEFKVKCRPLSVFKSTVFHWEKSKGSFAENLAYCTKENSLSFKHGPVPVPVRTITPATFYKWQKDIHDIIITTPDDRTIHWYYERIGNVGKSSFCKYLCVHHDCLIVSGKAGDCFYAIQQYMEKHNGCAPDIIVFDIPRCNIDYVSYLAIEKIKDGLFFSGKYEGGMVCFNPPHIFCFANERPEKDKLSLDRWNIVKITT